MLTLNKRCLTLKLLRFKLQNLYYYLFLATFTVIIFVNIFPSDLVILTRPFVVLLGALSLFLVNEIKVVLYVLLFYLFISLYTLYPLITNDVDIQSLIKNTRYTIYFVFAFGLVNIMRFISIDRLLYDMSKIFILKLVLVAVVSINMNFGEELFANYILNGMDLIVHRLFGAYRVFDVYLFLFPLVLIYIRGKKTIIKLVIHGLLLFNVLSSMTVGIILPYSIVMLLRYNIIRVILFFLVIISILMYKEYLLDFYNIFQVEKSVSIDVKLNQFRFLIDHMSLWGQGLGTSIDIQGRVDSMLENVFIYWFVIYGIIGSAFMILFFIFFPFLISYKYKKVFSIVILFYMHLSILIATATNPFLESVIGIMPMLIIISYFFTKNIERAKFNTRS